MSIKKIAAIIQARTGSQRLPNKILLKIKSKPLIWWLVQNLKKSKNINEIILATTKSKKDDYLVNYCLKNLKIKVYRGSENNVLKRVTQAAIKNNVDINVECFGDSPFVDSKIIDEFITEFTKLNTKGVDCLTNCFKKTYPAGMEILIYKTVALKSLNNKVNKRDKMREHVGFNFSRFKKIYKIKNKLAQRKYKYPNFYIEIDTQKDFIFLKKMIHSFKKIQDINLLNMIKIIKEKKLFLINNREKRRWKLLNEKYN